MFNRKLKTRVLVLEARQELMQKAMLVLTEIVSDFENKIEEVNTKMACKPKPMGKKK